MFKKIALIGLMLVMVWGLSAQSQANAIDKYFQQYVEDERFTVVYISPKMFELIGKLDVKGLDIDGEGEAALEIMKDIKGLRILITEDSPKQFYEEFTNKINTSEYETLMTVRNKKEENVDFLVMEEAGKISELLLLVGGGDEFVLLSFVGNLDIDKISKLAKEIDEQ